MHPDAYKIMHYYNSAKDESLYIWNARDGGSPKRIVIFSRTFVHINPERDIYLPAYAPNIGDWIFAPAGRGEERSHDVPSDAPQLTRVDAAMWDYFMARGEGFLAGILEERRQHTCA